MTIDDAASCLPPATESGVMSADNKTCTYASGAVVTFNPALVFPITNAMVWNFTIASNGQDCLHYEDTALGFKLTVAGQTVTESSSGGLGLTVSCPDGKSYSNSNSLSLFDCNADSGASAGGIPGKATSWTDTSVSFGLIGNSSSSEAQLFNCSQP
jgi:hypothetical protein